MDIEKLLWILVTALITFAFTKLWDWWRDAKKTKYEEQKLLNNALYNLVNLWQTLQTWDFPKQIDLSSELILEQFKKLGADPNDVDKLKIKEADKTQLIALQTKLAKEKFDVIETEVKKTIDALSTIRPLIASEIKAVQLSTPGNSITQIVEEQLKDGKVRSEYDYNMIIAYQNEYFQKFKEKLSERIKPVIFIIAEEIDKKTLTATKKRIEDLDKEWKEVFEQKDSKETEKYVISHTDILMKAHNQATKELDTLKTPNKHKQKKSKS